MIRTWTAVAITGLSLVANSSIAGTTEIRLFSPLAMKGAMPEVIAQFEKSSPHKVKVEYGTVGALFDRLQKDEGADVAIVSGSRLEDLLKQGKIVAGSRADIAKVGIGVFVRTGAPKPDIASVDAFKRTLLVAKSVGYGDPAAGGVSGVHMAGLVDRLGITVDMKPKTRLFANSQVVMEAVVRGEAEIGIGLTSDVALLPGVDLVGGLPGDVQNFTHYAAGIPGSSKQADTGKAFIQFLSSPIGRAILKAKGFEPH